MSFDGKLLRALRKALGMSLKDAAAVLNVAVSTLQRWERKQVTDVNKIEFISDVFGVPIQLLIFGAAQPEKIQIAEDCKAVAYMKEHYADFRYENISMAEIYRLCETTEKARSEEEEAAFAECESEAAAWEEAASCDAACDEPKSAAQEEIGRKEAIKRGHVRNRRLGKIIFFANLAATGILTLIFLCVFCLRHGVLLEGETTYTIVNGYELFLLYFFPILLVSAVALLLWAVCAKLPRKKQPQQKII